jgi:hypothetical protein
MEGRRTTGMSAPIVVLGSPRSGASVVAGLLVRAGRVATAELLPPTEDRPMGSFEAYGVVNAHREILAQLERDWTCPPSAFRPDALDLSALREQVEVHQALPNTWLMKEPSSMFLLPAWRHLGVGRVRLVAVARPPGDTIRSLVHFNGIPQLHAEAIVEAYLGRMAEIAARVALPVVDFPGDGDDVVTQVRGLAAALDLPWDDAAAEELYAGDLVRHRSALRDPSPAYAQLMERAQRPDRVPEVELGTLEITSEPSWPLSTCYGPRHAQQLAELWRAADFASFTDPSLVEVVPDGAPAGAGDRPGLRLHRLAVADPRAIGAALVDSGVRPHGVIAHRAIEGQSPAEVEQLLRAVHFGTHPLAQLVVDVPAPAGAALSHTTPPPPAEPTPAEVEATASDAGYGLVSSQRISPGRVAMVFRKRVLADSGLATVVDELVDTVQDLRRRLAVLEADAPDADEAGSGQRVEEGPARRAIRKVRPWRS